MAMPSHRLSISACWFAAPGICWVSTNIPFKASSKLIFSRTKAWGMAVVNSAFTPASRPRLGRKTYWHKDKARLTGTRNYKN